MAGGNHEKIITSFFFLWGIIMLVSEIWKQYTLTFVLGQGHYNLWYLPFQLCSIPMYVCLLIPWVKKSPPFGGSWQLS